jgi:tRNA 2-thiouridine synthesizing protein C
MTVRSNTQQKRTAIINSKAPFSQTHGKDALDVALIFGSFEQDVSLFFQGDGVWQLIKNQSTDDIQIKNYLKTFSAFEFYDIEKIFVCEQSLIERELINAEFHIDNVITLSPKKFSETLHVHQTIFRF